MPELDELSTINAAAVTDDDWLLIFNVSGDLAMKVRKDVLLDGLVTENEDATLGNLTVSNLTAGTATLTSLNLQTGGESITGIFAAAVSITFSGLTSGEVKEATTTISGVAVGDHVLLNLTTDMPADMNVMQVGISAANTLKVRAQNVGASTITGATYNGLAIVFRAA